MGKTKMTELELLARLGKAIKARRLELGKTQEEFSADVGINQSNISRLERGEQSLTLETLLRIVDALDTSLTALFAAVDNRQDINRLTQSMLQIAQEDPKRYNAIRTLANLPPNGQ